jgi:hypothetical protein
VFKINFTKFFFGLNGAPHHKDVSESGAQFRALLTLTLVGGKRPWGPLERGYEGLQRGNAGNGKEKKLCPWSLLLSTNYCARGFSKGENM